MFKQMAFRSLGALAMLVTSTAALVQPTAAMAQNRDGDYDRNYGRQVQQDRGYGDRDSRRDGFRRDEFRRDDFRRGDFRRDERDYRRQEWIAQERRERAWRNRERWETERARSAFFFGFGGRPDCR